MSKLKLTLAALALGLTSLAARPAFCGTYQAPVTEMGVKQCWPDNPNFSQEAITYIKLGGYYWDISAYDTVVTKSTHALTSFASPSAMFTTLAQMSMSTGSYLTASCATCGSHTCPGDSTTYWYLERLSLP